MHLQLVVHKKIFKGFLYIILYEIMSPDCGVIWDPIDFTRTELNCFSLRMLRAKYLPLNIYIYTTSHT